MKLCIRCKHYQVGDDRLHCSHPTNIKGPDVVWGGYYVKSNTVSGLRREGGDCGPEGRNWEPGIIAKAAMALGKVY